MEADDSSEEIETINNRSLAPIPTGGGGVGNDTADAASQAPNQSEQSIPLQSLLFLFLNNSFMQARSASNDDSTKENRRLSQAIEYLRLHNNKPPDEFVQDEQAIQSLIDVNDVVRKNKDKINFVIDAKLQLLLKDLFQYEYDWLRVYVERDEINIEAENTNPKFTTFHLICDLAEILVVSSKEFAALFHMVGGSKCFLMFFAHAQLMRYMTTCMTRTDPHRAERKMNYNKALSSMLNVLLYLKNNRTQAFKELNAIDTLTTFSNGLTFENCELILRAHFVLSVLASRQHIERRLDNVDFTILILEKTIQMFAQACQKKTKYNSYQFDLFYDNDVRSFEISSNNSPNTFIVIILSVIEAFLVNDEIKYRVFGTIKNSLLILLIQGDIVEKYFALCLLINFGFDDVLNEKMRQIASLPGIIEQMLIQSTQMDESVLTLVYCLKSLLDMRRLVETYKKTVLQNLNSPNDMSMANSTLTTPRSARSVSDLAASSSITTTTTTNLILISYNDVNELQAMKIRNELEKLDYNVKLIERKSYTTQKFDIDIVIKSIGDCELFLMCVSSSYEYDKMCEFEVELAVRYGKPYVLVNVQPKYAPDYWLESVAERRNVIPFSLASVRIDMTRIVREINAQLNNARRRRSTAAGNGLFVRMRTSSTTANRQSMMSTTSSRSVSRTCSIL